MTNRDESSKGFLERWSRKKIDAERETVAPAKADDFYCGARFLIKLPTPERTARRPSRDLTGT